MKILYYDCFCGISGDMNMAALIDLGVDKAYLIKELKKLRIKDEFELKITRGDKSGITGTRVDVLLKESKETHSHHDHEHDHHHGHKREHHHHEHRNLKVIEEIIDNSDLSENVKKISREIFMRVAIAEAKVHGKTIEEVHFHEVGAVDSIVDIIGAAICIDYLKVDKVMASKVHVGGGTVKCAHGIMPVPAPATSEILKGIPIVMGRVMRETTTPTGAAILAATVSEYTDVVDFNIEKIGYGVGHNDFDIPNILRVYLSNDNIEIQNKKSQYMIETNIDDMNPELYDFAEEMLFEAGALDVYRIPILMKKGRSGIKLCILVQGKDVETVKKTLFIHTTSIGLRKYPVDKNKMERTYENVMTKYGAVTVKTAKLDGEAIKYKAEYEECKILAKENKITIDDIYKEVAKQMEGY